MTNPFIRKLEHGCKLTDDDRAFLEKVTAKRTQYPARSDIIEEGDPPHDAHIIMRGFACRYKQMEDGGRQVMAIFVPGDLCDFHVQILGEMDHSIGTINAASVVSVPPDTIAKMTANPRINRGLWWMTLVDEGTLREWLVNLGKRSADQRLAHLFCELHLRMFSVGVAHGNRFELPLTQAILAEAMGLTSVHVNRTMQKLRDDDLIRTEGRVIVIPDLKRLHQFANFDANYLHLNEGSTVRPVE